MALSKIYEELGKLLNQTLESGQIKFVKVDNPLTEELLKEANSNADQNKPKEKKQSKKSTGPSIYKSFQIDAKLEASLKILGCNINSTDEEIKKAYKEKIKYFHPDNYDNNEIVKNIATKKTAQILEAYEYILSKKNNFLK